MKYTDAKFVVLKIQILKRKSYKMCVLCFFVALGGQNVKYGSFFFQISERS